MPGCRSAAVKGAAEKWRIRTVALDKGKGGRPPCYPPFEQASSVGCAMFARVPGVPVP